MTKHSIQTQYNIIRERISKACRKAGRSIDDVSILAVSKMQTVESIREAYECGIRDFGENYVQELIDKQQALSDLPDIRWHFIGHLQRNKAKLVQQCFAIHSVDSLELAKKLADTRNNTNTPLHLYLQLEVDPADENKFGMTDTEARTVCEFLSTQTSLRCVGFMGIGPNISDSVKLMLLYNQFVARGHELWKNLSSKRATHDTPQFSLGMSGDLETAVLAGSHIVRIGTALFGERSPR